MRAVQAGLMAATHVAAGGNLDFSGQEENAVLKIIREEDDPAANKSWRLIPWVLRRRGIESLKIPKCRVPATVRVTVLYAETGQLQGKVGKQKTQNFSPL
jgi:hypothetical protein